MKYKIGDKVRIVPPNVALAYDRKGKCATITNCYTDGISYDVVFLDGFVDRFYETWLEKVEEGVNIPQQPTVPPIPKKMDWPQIKEIAEMALVNKKDITITINADGSKEIEITTPTTSIVETQMRTRYVPEGTDGYGA